MPEPAALSPSVEDPRRSAAFHIRTATASDARRLGGALAEAFYADPILCWLMPDDASRLKRLRRFFAIALRQVVLPRGRVWSTAQLTGAALTLPPGRWRVPPRATLNMGAMFGTRLTRAARLLAAMEWQHPRELHYYFANVGVSPGLQGQGIGSALMRPTLERCDAEGLPAYLEASSERNAVLYERLGFRVLRELQVAGSPPLRPMSRPPRRSAVIS
jgi:GNAT superfamily N-acetyltransferase